MPERLRSIPDSQSVVPLAAMWGRLVAGRKVVVPVPAFAWRWEVPVRDRPAACPSLPLLATQQCDGQSCLRDARDRCDHLWSGRWVPWGHGGNTPPL
jgi:hypothetical protein